MARDGAPEGSWLRADVQTGGRGRHGRTWVSPPGNLYASTIVRRLPGDPPPQTLAMLTAVALDELLQIWLPADRLTIKWPNDLLVGGAKISGILLEAAGEAVVVGIGVNLAHHPDLPDRAVTSLTAQGATTPAPADFVVDLTESFARWLGRWRSEGLAPILARWQVRAHPIGTALSVREGDGVIDGLYDGLDADGALRLRSADGSVQIIRAGDVFLL